MQTIFVLLIYSQVKKIFTELCGVLWKINYTPWFSSYNLGNFFFFYMTLSFSCCGGICGARLFFSLLPTNSSVQKKSLRFLLVELHEVKSLGLNRSVSIFWRSGLWLCQSFCCRVATVFGIIIASFDKDLRRMGSHLTLECEQYTEQFMVDSVSVRSCGCTMRPNDHLSTSVFDSWYNVFLFMLCCSFYELCCCER